MSEILSTTHVPQTKRGAGIGSVLGWAIYLGTSWTWCIGMFLPVLVLRELGFVGFFSFALPNVIGAAALGWVVRSAEQSRRMVAENRGAFVWFSVITIVYHAFFAAWMIRQIAGPGTGVAIAGLFVFFFLILQWRRGGNFLAAAIALAVSLGVMAWGFWRGELPYVAQPVEGSRLPMIDNLYLAPAWLFGFLCCPYLDLTFHAARQALGRGPARAAFGVGFGIVFAAMLVFTVCYSGWFAVGLDRARYPQLAFILAAHLITQSCLTAAMHAKEVARVQGRFYIRQFLAFAGLLVVAVLFGLVSRDGVTYDGIPIGEIGYRAFLGFYGLVFPAYVWLRMVGPKRSIWRVVMTVIIALPMFWLGFVQERMEFIVPGVLIVVLAKVLLGGSGGRT